MIDGARPEIEVVCLCVTPSPGDHGRERLETLLRADLDWEFVLEFARHHGVAPQVYRRLVGGEERRIGEEVPSELEAMQRTGTARNLRAVSALHELFDRFEEEAIRALPIKGPVLAEAVYGNLSARTFNDLDVLVHASDLPHALDVMESMGYERRVDAPRLDDAAILGGPLTPSLANEYTLERSGEDVPVEVGWRVGTDPYSFEPGFETFWERRVSTTVADRTVPTLAPDDRLLLLTYHGLKHGWWLLKWVADVAWTVHTSTDLDWSGLYERAREYGITRRLVVGLGVANRLLEVDVPGLEQRLEGDEVATDIVAEVHDRFVERPLCEMDEIEDSRFHLAASESLRSRLFSRLFTTPLQPGLAEYQLLPLPGPLHPVYYLLRPLRVIVVYGVLNRLDPEPS